MNKVTIIIFAGRKVSCPIEYTMALSERAIARDIIDRAMATGLVDRVIVATDSGHFAQSLAGLPVTVDIDEGEFHFGGRLKDIIHRYAVDRAFYLGAGSAPLLDTEQIAGLCRTLLTSEKVVLANNFYSSDFVAFVPGEAIDQTDPPETDNNLAFQLHHRARLPNVAVPASAATQMDIDTPTDLEILSLHPGVGPHTRDFMEGIGFGHWSLNRLIEVISDSSKEVLIAGRIGSRAWALVESGFACRTRVISEERGMRASGRIFRGEVRSILGSLLDSVGHKRFFETLGDMVDGAIIDTRVIFEHFGLKPSDADRFYSDALLPEYISDRWLRTFTQRAAKAPIPIILGGHSLVSGDLWTLVDVASRRKEDGDRVRWSAHPSSISISDARAAE
ncbi:MAG: hypothetical protein M1358_07325 [Chloroflexi bacterium]|nr:hypothetical protein [Chloroflexota bacterium]